MGSTVEWAEITSVIIPLCSVVVGAALWIVKLIGDLKSEVAAFKTEVAKDYASMATLEKFEDRLMAAIDKLGDRLDRRDNKSGA